MAELSRCIIIIDQEGRFLLADNGGHCLVIVPHLPGFNPQDLRAPARKRRGTGVGFRQPDHPIAGIGEEIELANSSQAGRHSLADGIRGFFRDSLLPRQLAGRSARAAAAQSSNRTLTRSPTFRDGLLDQHGEDNELMGSGERSNGERLNNVPFAIEDGRPNGC